MRDKIGLGLSAGLASLILSTTLHAAAGGAEPVQVSANAIGKKCEVTVDRSRALNTFDVTRQELENGQCICYAYTGASSQSAQVEQRITDLLRTRECTNATPLAVAGPGSVSGKGFFGSALAPLLGLGAAGGAAAALAPESP